LQPAHPKWFKIGCTVLPVQRLTTYQTGDPHRAYRYTALWELVNVSIRQKEELLRQVLVEKGFKRQNEWVSKEGVTVDDIKKFANSIKELKEIPLTAPKIYKQESQTGSSNNKVVLLSFIEYI
jgi:hypothetical protein